MDSESSSSETSDSEEEQPTPQISKPSASTPTPAPRKTETLAPGVAKLPVNIRTLEGKTFKIQAQTDWTVKRLKEEVKDWNERASQCILQYRARRLIDEDLLSVYNIEPDSIIQANFRSTGGK